MSIDTSPEATPAESTSASPETEPKTEPKTETETETETTLPESMNAAAIDELGGPDVVHTHSLPVPRPAAGEVLIEVAAAGVGVWDPALVRGDFTDGVEGFPRVIGADGAGTIVMVGDDVKSFHVGDRVYGFGFGNLKGGFYAEYIALPARNVAQIPEALSFEQAGALAVSGLTALEGLEELSLKEGSSILILGASGGVGHIAVQLARLMGIRVVAVASGRDGVALVRRLGAAEVIDGKHDDVLKAARSFGPWGYEGALVFAGREDGWKDVLALVNKGGVVAYPNGVEPVPLARKRVELRAYDGESSPEAFSRLNRIIERGPFHVEVSHLYSLGEASTALKNVETHHLGKVALKIH